MSITPQILYLTTKKKPPFDPDEPDPLKKSKPHHIPCENNPQPSLNIPDWKIREKAKEQAQALRAEAEYQRRQESLKNPAIDSSEHRQQIDVAVISEKRINTFRKDYQYAIFDKKIITDFFLCNK